MYDKIISDDTVTYGCENADLYVTDINASTSGTSAILHLGPSTQAEIKLRVPGIFNLDNAMCAIGCAMYSGITFEQSILALETFSALPGRMEQIDEGQNFNVFVDFTMTEEAYEKTIQTLKKMTEDGKKVIVLFGCCGNRMKEKRPKIAKIVSELADVTIVAGDETYGEDPDKVVDEVWSGIDQNKTEGYKYYDRREGIKHALNIAHEGDTVAFCGMGPFSTFNTLKGPVPWDERKVVRELLNSMQ